MFAKVKERIEAGARAGNAGSSGGGGNQAGAEKKAMPSIISRDMVVNGNLDTPGEVHVEGTIRGDVSCAKLIIGASGNVEGHIFANAVRIHGSVRGEINAEEVFLLNGSSVSGDVVQNMLEIAPGAAFEGAVRRRGTVTAPRMLAAPLTDMAAADTGDIRGQEPPTVVSPPMEADEKGRAVEPEPTPLELTDPVLAEDEAAAPGIAVDTPSAPVQGKVSPAD